MLIPSSVVSHISGGGSFTPNALSFYNGGSGTNYLTIGSLTGIVDSYTGSISLWARFDGGNGIDFDLTTGAIAAYLFRFTDNNQYIYLFDTSGNQIVQNFSTGAQASGTGWHHILASWNTNFGAGSKVFQLFIDEVNVSHINADSLAATQVGYAGKQISYPSSSFNNQMSLSEIWFAPGQFIDFTVSANRDKFSAGGHPISLGATGNLPTGVAPAVYLHNAAATAGTNSGTGGNFTIQGTITDTTHP